MDLGGALFLFVCWIFGLFRVQFESVDIFTGTFAVAKRAQRRRIFNLKWWNVSRKSCLHSKLHWKSIKTWAAFRRENMGELKPKRIIMETTNIHTYAHNKHNRFPVNYNLPRVELLIAISPESDLSAQIQVHLINLLETAPPEFHMPWSLSSLQVNWLNHKHIIGKNERFWISDFGEDIIEWIYIEVDTFVGNPISNGNLHEYQAQSAKKKIPNSKSLFMH